MKTLLRWLAPCAVAALVVLAIGPAARAADDDFGIVSVPERILVGKVVLEPGTYFLRAFPHASNLMLIRVSNADETKVHALVLAMQAPRASEQITPSNNLVFQGSGPSRLRTWEAAYKGLDYFFLSDMSAPQQVTGTRMVTPVRFASR